MGSEHTKPGSEGPPSKPDEANSVVQRDGGLEVEAPENYIRKAHADVKRSEAKTARLVAIVLVLALVVSFPLQLAIFLIEPSSMDRVEPVFRRWYDIVAPLVGMVIGGIFGLVGGTARNRPSEDVI